MKKILSLLLVLCTVFSYVTPVFATEAAVEETTVVEAETEVLTDENHVQNVVLFALCDTVSLESVRGNLTDLGISQTEPLFTDEDGNAKPIGTKNEVWYRAYTSEDVYETVDALNNIKGITYSEPEYIYTSDHHGMPKEFDRDRDWPHHKHLHKHRNDADEFWWETEYNHDFAPGSGTIVAVIDTGVDYTHEDLASNMWVNTAEMYGTAGVDDDLNGYIDDIYGADTTATGKKAGNPMDDNGHGTHVAGIIGMAANGEGGIGLAYGAKIMAVKAGQSTGSFSSSHIAKAINYAHMMGADVINMSFGGTSKSQLVETALEDAFADCVLVASAGNNGRPTTDADPDLYPKREDVYPAAYPYVLGVMATDRSGNLASFSNWDYEPNEKAEYELTAPGKDIYSTLPGNRYAKWSGTSMAAPFVSATAAIVRSHYSDKDTYSSRFIMGQISSATTEKTYYTSKDGYYAYPALNVYDSIYYLPKPNVTVKDKFLMDNVTEGTVNDGDGIIDAGEVIDLGVLVRNQWGLTGEITVKADAISEGGVANPWVEFVTDEITLQSAGTFQEVNNGFIYDDSLLTGVENPIRFKVSSETPNDTQIKINITVTTTNGIDEADETVYTTTEPVYYTFRVQAGRGISGTLTEDTTLTNDYLWIVENSLFIPEGITLTIEPGTKVQFYSSDYETAYGGLTIANITCAGTLNAIGTEDAPIEMYPGAGFERFAVVISGSGTENYKYCKIINPAMSGVNADHCEFINNYSITLNRKVSSGTVSTYEVKHPVSGNLTNCRLINLTYYQHESWVISGVTNSNMFLNCDGKIVLYKQIYNNLFLNTTKQIDTESSLRIDLPEFSEPFTYENSESKYVVMYPYHNDNYYRSDLKLIEAVIKDINGTLACFNNVEEEAYLFDMLHKFRSENNYDSYRAYIGCKYVSETDDFIWADSPDNTYDFYTTILNKYSGNVSMLANTIGGENNNYIYTDQNASGNYCFLLEFPATYTDKEITDALTGFDYKSYFASINQTINNCAIINPVLNNDPNSWLKVVTDYTYSASKYVSVINNYWGTENKALINKFIVDGDDYPGTYLDIIEDPILTLESESLADIYPFVTKVYLTDDDGNIVSNVQPGEEYNVHVHFNRDMDMSTQPSVSYGGAEPYTDYMVDGDFVSPREWVGATRISPVLTSGTMYFRTNGGCAADDKWLVCGEDILRFSFNISSTGALAMLLSAEGGANKVELSWAQNDYETLAGYNLYRSTSETSGFSKINTTVIADTEYTDTNVAPGVTYYYYFKVVNTDGNEEASVSNTASGTPIDNIFPVLKHSALTSAKAGSQITISATATDNIGVTAVKLYYKTGDGAYKEKAMTEGATANLYVATIPASAVTKDGVCYYVTAEDADGNVSYSGTKEIPHVISVNADAYISGITPSKVNIDGGKTISILGGNFTSDMVLKVGGKVISDVSFVDGGQITFIAPAASSGSHAVTLTTTDGKVITSPTPLSYTDAASMAQIPTSMTLVSGVAYTIPLYISASGDVISLHAELDLPSADFTNVKVEKANENANFTLDYTYSGGVLKLGCIGTSNIKPADGAIVNIVVTPRVTEDKQYDVTLHDVLLNDVAATTVISGQVHIKPSYLINALVKYYKGTNIFVDGVTISAAGATAITDENGAATLNVSDKTVTISAAKATPNYAITAYDASLVLQSAIGKITLTDNQKLAADVDGDGTVSEYDAALILQKAVKKIDAFPIGKAWVFTPSFIDKTLTSSGTSVTFTAISIGDVDGSYAGE